MTILLPSFTRPLLLATAVATSAWTIAGCNKAPDATPSPTVAPVSYLDQVFIPGKDDKLHPHHVSRNAVDTQIKAGGNPTPALDEIVRAAPAYFPPQTRVKGFKADGKQFVVDLNAAFTNSKHWTKGELITELAVYALVNSAAQVDKSGKTPVQLTVEGKPLSTLGEFDASDAIEPNRDLMAADDKPAATEKPAPKGAGSSAKTQ